MPRRPSRAEYPDNGDLRQLCLLFTGGVLCVNSRHEVISSEEDTKDISSLIVFLFRCWPMILGAAVYSVLGFLTGMPPLKRVVFGCFVSLVFIEMSLKFCIRKKKMASAMEEVNEENSFILDEEKMSRVDTVRCQIEIRYVKFIKKKWKFKICVKLSETEYQWREWRSLDELIYVQNQLKIDFDSCPLLDSSEGALLKTPLELERPEFSKKEKTIEELNAELRHKQVVISAWLNSVKAIPLFCNHIEFRRFLGLPKYAFRFFNYNIVRSWNNFLYSNRYGSNYVPKPKELKKQRQTLEQRQNSGVMAQQDFNENKISKGTRVSHSLTRLKQSKDSESSAGQRRNILSRIFGRSKPDLSQKNSEPKTSLTHQKEPSATSNQLYDTSPAIKTDSSTVVKTLPTIIAGSTWRDVVFTDQSAVEKGFFEDMQYSHGFLVRGKTYGMDRKKVDSGPALCRLIMLEVYEVECDSDSSPDSTHLHRHDHIASQGAVKARLEALQSVEDPPFVFVMNFQIPGDPPISIVSMFAVPPELSEPISSRDSADMQAQKRLWQAYIDMPGSEEERLEMFRRAERETDESSSSSSFFSGWRAPSDITWAPKEEPGVYPSTDFKNQRFKLVPTVTEGNWLVKASVPSAKPALLGQKVQQRYFKGPNYIETDVDVGSSVIAQNIVGMCRGYAKNFECNIAVILQGESAEELPERVLCAMKIVNIDVECRRKLFQAHPSLNLATKSQHLDCPASTREEGTAVSFQKMKKRVLDVEGCSWRDVVFTDQSAVEKGFFEDMQYSHGFLVRGKTYGMDRKKVDSGPALCRLIMLEVYEVECDSDSSPDSTHLHRHDHIASQGAVKARLEALQSVEDPPFVFVMNFQIPGDPPISIVSMFAVPPELSEPISSRDSADMQAQKRLWQAYIDMPGSEEERLEMFRRAERETDESSSSSSFFSGWRAPSDITWAPKEEPGVYPSTDFKNQRFKLVCCVDNAEWVVRSSVPSYTPTLLGQKVQQRYFKGPNYIETDVDVGSSVIAQNIVGMCRGYAKNFECNIAVILQGESAEELPERVLCALKIVNIDVECRHQLGALTQKYTSFSGRTCVQPPTFGGRNAIMSCSSLAQTIVHKNLSGYSWRDVVFTDQSAVEKGFFEDMQYSHGFLVRGKTYGMDRKKVDSGPALCRLIMLEVYEVECDSDSSPDSTHLHRHDHIASQGAVKARLEALQSVEDPPFVFVMNFQIPGDPPISIVSMFAVPPELSEPISSRDSADMQAQKRLWQAYIDMPGSEEERLEMFRRAERETDESSSSSSFFSGWRAPSDITWAPKEEPGVYPSTDFKNQRFKLVPTVTEGNWLVKASVPSAKPALLGQKVQQRYFKGPNYIETDVDVGSSVIAQNIVGMCRGYAKNFECNIAVILQGESAEELPERVLCALKIVNIDVECRRKLFQAHPSLNLATKSQHLDCPASTREEGTAVSFQKMKKRVLDVEGCSWRDVVFTDQSAVEKGFFEDMQYSHGFLVRGKTYGMDRKKVDSGPALCRLIMLEVYEVECDSDSSPDSTHLHRHDHIASQGAVKARLEALQSVEDPPFVFVMNFQIPGDPPISIVSMFAVPPELSEPISSRDSADMQAQKRLWQAYIDMPGSEEERLEMFRRAERETDESSSSSSFFSGWRAPSDITWAPKEEPGVYPSTDFKNQRFKLVPTVTEGNWLVKASVPSAKPALLGQKVQQRYFKGPNYIETDVDVGSSVIAQNIVGMCRGYAKNFECNIAVILQGESAEELPERVLCALKIVNIDVECRRKLFQAHPSLNLATKSQHLDCPASTREEGTAVSFQKMKKRVLDVEGCSWRDVVFTDQSAVEKGFFEDMQYSHGFLVRGKTYGMDRKKVDSGPALCRLIMLEVYEVECDSDSSPDSTHLHRHDHIASQGAVKARLEALQSVEDPPFVFVMNFQIPGDPPISIVSMFAVPPELSEPISSRDSADMQAQKRLWQAYIDMPGSEEERLEMFRRAERETDESSSSSSFFSGWRAPSDITWAPKEEPGVYPSTDFKNQRFKLVPTVTEGNWLVKASVPSAKPALLGQKVQQRYFKGPNYIETDVDVGSSVIAQNIVGMCRGYAKNFECNIAVILQGESAEELPERVLCAMKIVNIDVECRRKLYNKR